MIARRLQLAPWLTFLFPPRRRYRGSAHRAAARRPRPDFINALRDATRQANESNGRIGNAIAIGAPLYGARRLCEASDYVAVRGRSATTRCGRSPAGTSRAGRRKGADVAIQPSVMLGRRQGEVACRPLGGARTIGSWLCGSGSQTRWVPCASTCGVLRQGDAVRTPGLWRARAEREVTPMRGRRAARRCSRGARQ
jgi:hypothetical protein